MATQYQPVSIPPVFAIIKNDAGELRHQTPEQLHPGQIVGDGNAADQTRQAFTAASSALATLNTKFVKGSPDFERSLEAGFRQTINPALDQAKAALKLEEAALTKTLADKCGFKVDPTIRALVVGTIQGLAPGERASAIAKLVDEQDGGTLAILSELSPVLTKLTDEVRDGIKPRLFSKADPATYKRLQNTQANLAKVEAGSFASLRAYAKFSAPQNRFGSDKPEVNKSVAE